MAQRLRTVRDRLLQLVGVVVSFVLVRTRSADEDVLRVLQRIHPVLQLTVLVRKLGDVIRLAKVLAGLLIQRTEALSKLLAERADTRRQVLPVLHAGLTKEDRATSAPLFRPSARGIHGAVGGTAHGRRGCVGARPGRGRGAR